MRKSFKWYTCEMDSEYVVGGTGDSPFLTTSEEKFVDSDAPPARGSRKMSPEGDSINRRSELFSPSSSRVGGPSTQGMSRRDKRLTRELEYNRRRLGEHRAADARYSKEEVVEPSPASLRYEQRVSELEDTPLRYPDHEVPPPPSLTVRTPGRIRPGAPLPVPKGWMHGPGGRLVRSTEKARTAIFNFQQGKQVCWNCGAKAGSPHRREGCAARWVAKVERGDVPRCEDVSLGTQCVFPKGHTHGHRKDFPKFTSEGANAGHNTGGSRWIAFKS